MTDGRLLTVYQRKKAKEAKKIHLKKKLQLKEKKTKYSFVPFILKQQSMICNNYYYL